MTNFVGRIFIQGSIAVGRPSNNDEWYEIDSMTIPYSVETNSGFTGSKYLNVDGKYLWVRALYNPDPLNTGTIDKALFR